MTKKSPTTRKEKKVKTEHPLRKEGWKRVEDTSGKIIDSVWVKSDGVGLIIKFAWGGTLNYLPLEQIPENASFAAIK